MADRQLVLVDLSSLAYPIWHMSSAEPDPEYVSRQIVERVRRIGAQQPHVAVCRDMGKSFRVGLDPTYKANRPEREAALMHQIDVAVDTLRQDGYPLWGVRGYEADDIVATATSYALAGPDAPFQQVLIISSDKDLLQLVAEQVHAQSVRDGAIYDPDAVFAKFGVRPDQMRDYLTLVGDASDNIKGARGIGPKKASSLLMLFGSLDAYYAAVDAGQSVVVPASTVASLEELRPRLQAVRDLVTLSLAADIPFPEVLASRSEREPKIDLVEDDMPDEPTGQLTLTPPTPEQLTPAPTNGKANALAVVTPQEPDVLAPPPVEWEKHLEPRSMREARSLAKDMHDSRLFLGAHGNAQAVLSTILAGRELGLQAMASLRAIHVIEGKPTLAADLMRALVLRSGKAKYFRCTERTPERATFETQRGEDPPITLPYTIADAQIAGVVKPGSGWIKNPADMLVARASAKLARLVYADVIHGLYAPEEFD